MVVVVEAFVMMVVSSVIVKGLEISADHCMIFPFAPGSHRSLVRNLRSSRLRHPDGSAQVVSAVRRSAIVVKTRNMASQSSVLEQQNNQRLEELSRKVTSLRNVWPFLGFATQADFLVGHRRHPYTGIRSVVYRSRRNLHPYLQNSGRLTDFGREKYSHDSQPQLRIQRANSLG